MTYADTGHVEDAEHTVQVSAGSVMLDGTLQLPAAPSGIVLFAHGSGSSRFSPRNRYVAQVLRNGGLATLLVDLLTAEEEQVDLRTRHIRFDIELLAERVVAAIDWMTSDDSTAVLSAGLPVGLFGASTGAAAALVAATRRPLSVQAVVSRGGRPDLADAVLPSVQAPTLLIVGGDDGQVIELNELALRRMHTATQAAGRPLEVQLKIVPGATHLFEEPGTLEQVAVLSRDWFVHHLTLAPTAPVTHR